MNWLLLSFVFALALSLDCFALSVTDGLVYPHMGRKKSFFAAQVEAMTLHYRVPGVGMIGHGIEQHSVHVEQYCFETDTRMPAIFKIAGYGLMNGIHRAYSLARIALDSSS